MTRPHNEPAIPIMTLNLETDDGPGEGGQPPELWRDAHEELLAFRQVSTFSAANGNRRPHSAERVLRIRGFLSPIGHSRHPTATFERPETFQVHQLRPSRRRGGALAAADGRSAQPTAGPLPPVGLAV